MSQNKSCKNCKFSAKVNYDFDKGEFVECRYNPPTPMIIKDKTVTRFPLVEINKWCGLFEVK